MQDENFSSIYNRLKGIPDANGGHGSKDCVILVNTSQDAKADAGKLQISLVPTQIIRDIAQVRMYGTLKYHSPDNWKRVELQRYVDALLRHTLAFVDNMQSKDEESGIEHYKHMACNMAFICDLLQEVNDEQQTVSEV